VERLERAYEIEGALVTHHYEIIANELRLDHLDIRPPHDGVIGTRIMNSLTPRARMREIKHSLPMLSWMLGDGCAFKAPQPGRRGYPTAFYALKAKAYVEACVDSPNDPMAHLCDELDDAKTWRRHLDVARKKGLLEGRSRPGVNGVAPRLTEKAIRELENLS